jgi:hypothetical protein
METLLKYFLLPALCGVAAMLGAFWGQYFKKRGENLATHEDVETLIEDLRQTTTAVKEIEAKISNDTWARQRRWDIKRDVVTEALKELGTLQAILALYEIEYEKSQKAQNLVRRKSSGSNELGFRPLRVDQPVVPLQIAPKTLDGNMRLLGAPVYKGLSAGYGRCGSPCLSSL